MFAKRRVAPCKSLAYSCTPSAQKIAIYSSGSPWRRACVKPPPYFFSFFSFRFEATVKSLAHWRNDNNKGMRSLEWAQDWVQNGGRHRVIKHISFCNVQCLQTTHKTIERSRVVLGFTVCRINDILYSFIPHDLVSIIIYYYYQFSSSKGTAVNCKLANNIITVIYYCAWWAYNLLQSTVHIIAKQTKSNPQLNQN